MKTDLFPHGWTSSVTQQEEQSVQHFASLKFSFLRFLSTSVVLSSMVISMPLFYKIGSSKQLEKALSVSIQMGDKLKEKTWRTEWRSLINADAYCSALVLSRNKQSGLISFLPVSFFQRTVRRTASSTLCVWWNSWMPAAPVIPSSVTAPTSPCAARMATRTPTTVFDARRSVWARPSSPSSTQGPVVSGDGGWERGVTAPLELYKD